MMTSICALTLEVYYRYLPLYQIEGKGKAMEGKDKMMEGSDKKVEGKDKAATSK